MIAARQNELQPREDVVLDRGGRLRADLSHELVQVNEIFGERERVTERGLHLAVVEVLVLPKRFNLAHRRWASSSLALRWALWPARCGRSGPINLGPIRILQRSEERRVGKACG